MAAGFQLQSVMVELLEKVHGVGWLVSDKPVLFCQSFVGIEDSISTEHQSCLFRSFCDLLT